jgi:hypothetical protein
VAGAASVAPGLAEVEAEAGGEAGSGGFAIGILLFSLGYLRLLEIICRTNVGLRHVILSQEVADGKDMIMQPGFKNAFCIAVFFLQGFLLCYIK